MSNMASNAFNSPPKGFSILQPTLGAPLSWMPMVGSPELEQLINAYLPGPASAQEKRAIISMDFFGYAASTGENFKYYPVNKATSSSSGSSAFNTSPAVSDLSYHGSPSQAPASTPIASAPKKARATSQKSAMKTERTDFSDLPGMKIMTAAGEDVTNSVSRGCKTREQREHAHLMRVLKACDSCKRKKIRCDPSHKRRAAHNAKAEATKQATKPAKKAKKSSAAPSAQAAAFAPASDAPFNVVMGGFSTSLDHPWDEFLTFDPINEPTPQDFYNAVPQDFDFFLGNENHFSPANSGSSGSTDSPALPLTPVGSNVTPQNDFVVFNNDSSLFLQAGGQEPTLPYLHDGSHGSNYVDFNLYSPSSSFIDEEPQKLKAGDKRKADASLAEPQSQSQYNVTSTASLNQPQSSTGHLDNHEWRFDQSQPSTGLPSEVEARAPGHRRRNSEAAPGGLVGRHFSLACQSPWHADDGSHRGVRASPTTRTRVELQQQQAVTRLSPAASAVHLENHSLSGTYGHSTVVTSSILSPSSASPRANGRPDSGNAHMIPQTVNPTVWHHFPHRTSKFCMLTIE